MNAPAVATGPARVPRGAPASPADLSGVTDALATVRHGDRLRAAGVVGMLLAVLAALAVLALGLGAVPLSPGQVLGGLLGSDDGARFIVTGLRLPRLGLALAVGAALGLAGALLQAVVRNPLASPDVVGLTGGASAAGVLAIGAGLTGAAVGSAALVGALGAAGLVFALSGRGVRGTRFVVVGVAVAFLAQGVLGYALTRASLTEARSAYFWLVGSVGSAAWADAARVAAVLGAVVVVLALAHRPLRALGLDDDTARAVGATP
ncbi:membrane protein, partial [Actinotalea ferrariae CF5-4]